jgi:hypothetical protein
LLEFCKQKFGKKKGGGHGGDIQGNNTAASELMDSLLVEAAWDSDEYIRRSILLTMSYMLTLL